MRLSLLLYLTITIIMICQANAQQKDTLENEILNFVDKDEEIIKNARKLLLHSLSIMDEKKTAQVFDYLLNKYDGSSMVALWPYERWYLYLLLHRHKEYLKEVADYQHFFSTFEKKITPTPDKLNTSIPLLTSQSFTMLLQSINDSLKTEDQDFLVVGLYSMLTHDIQFISQDSLNGFARNYISQYPSSRYTSFIKKYILVDYRLSNLGLGISAGTGGCFLNGEVSKRFTSFVPIEYSLEVTYKKFFYGFHGSFGGSIVKQEINEPGNWYKGLNSGAGIVNIFLGYDVTSLSSPYYEVKKYRIIPYLFTGILGFSDGKSGSPETKNFNLFAYGCGVKNDFKITKRKVRAYSYTPAMEYFYIFLRIEPSVGIVALDNHKNFSGTYIKISASIGIFSRLIKRVIYKD